MGQHAAVFVFSVKGLLGHGRSKATSKASDKSVRPTRAVHPTRALLILLHLSVTNEHASLQSKGPTPHNKAGRGASFIARGRGCGSYLDIPPPLSQVFAMCLNEVTSRVGAASLDDADAELTVPVTFTSWPTWSLSFAVSPANW